MRWKLKGPKTQSEPERIKALEDRLDGAIAENRRLRAEFDAFISDPLLPYRSALRRRYGRPLPTPPLPFSTDDSDESVN